MRYCKKCVQTDTRPGIIFDKQGVCLACRHSENKKEIDWAKREGELQKIAEWAKRNSKEGYDCVIGVSGGKDSTFQALYARDKLGLNPLLVNSAPDNITKNGAHNIENLTGLGFDLFMIRPNPKVMRKLIKRDFYKYLNPQKVTEYPLWASTYQVALAYRIALIIQGENAGLTLGVKGVGTDDDAANVCKSNTLAGGDAFSEYGNVVEKNQLFQFQFPNRKLLDDVGIRAIYLQYYTKEWSRNHNAKFSIAYGLKIREHEDLHEMGRYTRFGGLDSDLNILNQMLKYYKFGFGFATDEACYEIREGIISREEGIRLVKEYDGKCGEKYIKDFCKYIDVTIDEFWRVVDKFVNRKLFEKDPKTGKWNQKFEVGVDFEE